MDSGDRDWRVAGLKVKAKVMEVDEVDHGEVYWKQNSQRQNRSLFLICLPATPRLFCLSCSQRSNLEFSY